MPLLLSLFLHLIDTLYLNDELVDGGVLLEVDPPAGTWSFKLFIKFQLLLSHIFEFPEEAMIKMS